MYYLLNLALSHRISFIMVPGTVGNPEAVAFVKKDEVELKGFYHIKSIFWRATGFSVHQKVTTVWNDSINASLF